MLKHEVQLHYFIDLTNYSVFLVLIMSMLLILYLKKLLGVLDFYIHFTFNIAI